MADEVAKRFPELHLMRCHRCGQTRYILGTPQLDEKGLTYCPVDGAGEGEQDGFGGINGAPPESDFLRAVENRQFELAGAMVRAGTNVHANADTALRWAASRGDVDAVEFLLDLDADITSHNYEALVWASKEKHDDVAKLLISRGADPSVLEEQAPEGELIGAGSTWNAEGHRWWSCPICKVYIDAEVDGRIIDADRLRCPKCGCLELDPDDGDHFTPGTEKLRPDIIAGGISDSLRVLIKDARATLTEAGMFPSDESDTEPKWPKDLAAVILAGVSEMTRRDNKRKKLPGELSLSDPNNDLQGFIDRIQGLQHPDRLSPKETSGRPPISSYGSVTESHSVPGTIVFWDIPDEKTIPSGWKRRSDLDWGGLLAIEKE